MSRTRHLQKRPTSDRGFDIHRAHEALVLPVEVLGRRFFSKNSRTPSIRCIAAIHKYSLTTSFPSYLDSVLGRRGHQPGAQVNAAPHHGVLAPLRSPDKPAVDLSRSDADAGPQLQPLKRQDYLLGGADGPNLVVLVAAADGSVKEKGRHRWRGYSFCSLEVMKVTTACQKLRRMEGSGINSHVSSRTMVEPYGNGMHTLRSTRHPPSQVYSERAGGISPRIRPSPHRLRAYRWRERDRSMLCMHGEAVHPSIAKPRTCTGGGRTPRS